MSTAATPTAPMASSRGWLLALAAVVAAGLGIRLLFLGDKALWLDEAYSVWFSQQSWHDLWRETPHYETHPPLYYSLLKLWRGLGSDEAVLRLLSVLANVATIGLVALTGYVAVPPPQRLMVACTSGLLFAVSPLQLGLAQQARPYALLMLGLGLALAGATWLVTHPARAARPLWRLGDGCRLLAYLGLSLGIAMLLWMHNLGAVFAIALGVMLGVWWTRQGGQRFPLFANFAVAALLALALYAPNLPTLLLQVNAVSENFWLKAPSPAALWLLLLQVYGQWQQLFSQPLQQIAVQSLLAVPLAVLGIGGIRHLCSQSQDHRWVPWLLLGAALVPLLIMLAVTYTVRPVLLARTLAPVQVPWAIVCGAAPFAAGGRRAPLIWGAICVVGLLNVAGFITSQATEKRRDMQRPWRAIAASIAASDAATAPIFMVPNGSALALGYYDEKLGTDLAIHPLPAAYPARGSAYRYPSGGRGEPAIDEAVLPALLSLTADAPSAWLITRLEDLFDPTQVVRNALAARFPCAESKTFRVIVVTRFDRPKDDAKPGAWASTCP